MKISTGGIGTVATSALASAGAGGFTKGVSRAGNKMPIGYSNFEGPDSDFGLTPPIIPPSTTQPTGFTYPGAKYKFDWDDNTAQDHDLVIVDRNSGIGVNGPHTLKVVMRPRHNENANLDWIRFGEGSFGGKEVNLDYIFEIPAGKLWEFSYYLRANTTIDVGVSQTFYCGNNTHFPIGSYFGTNGSTADWQTVSQADTWTKKTLIVDLRDISASYSQGLGGMVRPGGSTAPPAGDPFSWTRGPAAGGVSHPHEAFNLGRLYRIINSYSHNFHVGLFANSTYETPSPLDGRTFTANADVMLLNPGDTTQVGITLWTNASSTHSIEYHFDDFTFIEHEDQGLNTTNLGELT